VRRTPASEPRRAPADGPRGVPHCVRPGAVYPVALIIVMLIFGTIFGLHRAPHNTVGGRRCDGGGGLAVLAVGTGVSALMLGRRGRAVGVAAAPEGA